MTLDPTTPGPDWSRRDFLRAASLCGASALASAGLSRGAANTSVPGFGRARSCLLVFLAGGPSHIDTLDPKPDAPAEFRGEFRPIATRVPGLSFSEHLPRLASRADRLTVVRSMSHVDASHAVATYRTLTGRPYPRDPWHAEHASREDDPHIGSIAAASAASPCAVIRDAIGDPGPPRAGHHAGALGPEHDPRVVGWDAAPAPPIRERDLDRYGPSRFGRSLLLGRHLVGRGAPFVQVNWPSVADAGWDTHADGFAALKETLLPAADRALAALLDDLAADGSLDETLVVVLGEFGRSPRVTPCGGRGHWPTAYSAVLAGAGLPGGRAVGATDRIGACPVDRPIGPGELASTILLALGLRPDESGSPPRPGEESTHDAPVAGLWS